MLYYILLFLPVFSHLTIYKGHSQTRSRSWQFIQTFFTTLKLLWDLWQIGSVKVSFHLADLVDQVVQS